MGNNFQNTKNTQIWNALKITKLEQG
jgi:hypothetical protein